MSTLGQAVVAALDAAEKRVAEAGQSGVDSSESNGDYLAEVEGVLAAHQVSTSSFLPSPAKLQVSRILFRGTKILTGVTADGEAADPSLREEVPFDFDWEVSLGLNGVGSDKNLRGKSSVLRLIMWALRGRCDTQQEVRDWIDRIELHFSVDSDAYTVIFEVDHLDHNRPNGALTRIGAQQPIGTFSTDEEFEEVMGTAMMQSLRLPAISSQADGIRVQHVWPAYAGAFLIRGDNLDYLLGDVAFGGLPSRLLSMFVGTQWAVARAESTTAVTVVAAQLADLERSVAEHSSALSEAHGVALLAVDEARQKLAAIEVPDLDVDALRESLTRIATLDAEAARLSKQLRSARGTYAEIAGQLDSERSRREKELSEAVATKFFQNLRPTICPRCAAPVTEDRLQAESQGAACSVCVTDLDLSAHEHNLILSALTPEDERLRLERDADAINSAESDQYSDSDLVIDDLEALSEAAQGSQSRVDTLADTLQSIEVERDSITSVLESSAAAQAAAVRRQDAMVELARAEGAAAALAPRASAVGPSAEQIEALRRELRILEAAKATTTKWVQEGQAQRLIELSDTIAALARSFGMVNLTEVKLGGGATMKVVKGGSESTYSKMERGEKLRLKLATAIALIKLGRQSGVGRHPGLLFVDSPGAEEINDDDLDSMLVALNSEATAAEMQVFVATCHTDALVELLGAERCRLGRGNQFVW